MCTARRHRKALTLEEQMNATSCRKMSVHARLGEPESPTKDEPPDGSLVGQWQMGVYLLDHHRRNAQHDSPQRSECAEQRRYRPDVGKVARNLDLEGVVGVICDHGAEGCAGSILDQLGGHRGSKASWRAIGSREVRERG